MAHPVVVTEGDGFKLLSTSIKVNHMYCIYVYIFILYIKDEGRLVNMNLLKTWS